MLNIPLNLEYQMQVHQISIQAQILRTQNPEHHDYRKALLRLIRDHRLDQALNNPDHNAAASTAITTYLNLCLEDHDRYYPRARDQDPA